MKSYFNLKKKKKGFTLIELLAVIVILAILALIAIPIVISIIQDSRKSSAKRSVDSFGRAAAAAMSNYMTKNDKADYTSLLFDENDPDYIHNWDELVAKLNIKYSGSKVRCKKVCLSSSGAIGFSKCAVGKDAEKIVNENNIDKMVKDNDGQNFYIYTSEQNESITAGTWKYDTSTYQYWEWYCDDNGECYDTERTGYNVTSHWDNTAVNVDSSGTAIFAKYNMNCRDF